MVGLKDLGPNPPHWKEGEELLLLPNPHVTVTSNQVHISADTGEWTIDYYGIGYGEVPLFHTLPGEVVICAAYAILDKWVYSGPLTAVQWDFWKTYMRPLMPVPVKFNQIYEGEESPGSHKDRQLHLEGN